VRFPVFSFVVRSVVSSIVVAAAAGCQPFALKGESCEATPCAVGLVCIDGLCDDPPPPPPAPCTDDGECLLDGDASGRVCEEGVCRFADCAFDAQCGTRICIAGTCAPTEPCLEDDDCSASDGVAQLCIANQCRPPCFADDECGVAVGGFGLIHGLGLATKLQDLGLNREGLLENLIAFNIGVEIGQVLALSIILAAMTLWRTTKSFGRLATAANALLFLAGVVLAGEQLAGYFLAGDA
jgi:hypothetical protein